MARQKYTARKQYRGPSASWLRFSTLRAITDLRERQRLLALFFHKSHTFLDPRRMAESVGLARDGFRELLTMQPPLSQEQLQRANFIWSRFVQALVWIAEGDAEYWMGISRQPRGPRGGRGGGGPSTVQAHAAVSA